MATIEIGKQEVLLPLMGMWTDSFGPTLSPDGKLLACGVGSRDGSEIRLWDTATGKVAGSLRAEGAVVPSEVISFSHDSKKLLVRGRLNERLQLWNLETQKLERQIKLPGLADELQVPLPPGVEGFEGLDGFDDLDDFPTVGGGMLSALAISHSGEQLTIERMVDFLLWSAEGDTVRTLRGKQNPPRARRGGAQQGAMNQNPAARVAFSGDDKKLVALHANGEIRHWDLASGKSKVTLRGGKYHMTSLSQLSSNGRRVLHYFNGNMILLDTEKGRVLRRLRVRAPDGLVLAMSGDGRRLAYSRGDRKIQVTDLDTGKRLTTLTSRERTPGELSLSEDGSLLVSDHRSGGGSSFRSSGRGENQVRNTMTGKLLIWNLPAGIRSPGEKANP